MSSGEPKSKSPKYIPKFLRASFSKLISSKDKSKSLSLGQDPASLPYLSSMSSGSLGWGGGAGVWEGEREGEVCPACSPTTTQFVEDSVAQGFPLIPFNYTSLGQQYHLPYLTQNSVNY